MGRLLVLVAMVALFATVDVHGADWSYHGDNDGPGKWKDTYATCGLTKQSPINIKRADAEFDKDLGDFQKSWFDGKPTSMTLKNNGHSATISMVGGSTFTTTTALSGTYQAQQFHFHWGSANTLGSEHEFDGNQYFAELHVVCYNKKYADFGTAVDKADGLAVLGFFIDKKNVDDNAAMKKVTDHLGMVVLKDSEHAYPSDDIFEVSSLLPDDMDKKYYRYSGSLTTPGCFESVTWTVFESRITISNAQAELFYALQEDNVQGSNNFIVDNFRPVQPLNGRKVYHNSATRIGAAITMSVAMAMAAISSIVIL